MAIDRDTFEVGFLFGWYAGFVNYARVLKDNETLEWAQDNMCSLLNCTVGKEIYFDKKDVNNFCVEMMSYYSRTVSKNDPKGLDYWWIGSAFTYVHFTKKLEEAGKEKSLVSLMKKATKTYLSNASLKTVLFKSKFLNFLEYVVEKMDIESFNASIQIVKNTLDAIYTYLTSAIGKKSEAYSLVDYLASTEENYDNSDKASYDFSYSGKKNDISKFEKYISSKDENDNITSDNARPYVFISYSTKNKSVAETMRDILKKENIMNWMAPYDIPAGLDYPTVISNAIENCACVLLLLSNESQSSRYVYSEIRIAYDSAKPIISMNLDDCQLIAGFKLLLGTHQIVSVDSDDDLRKVIDAIKFNINKA